MGGKVAFISEALAISTFSDDLFGGFRGTSKYRRQLEESGGKLVNKPGCGRNSRPT